MSFSTQWTIELESQVEDRITGFAGTLTGRVEYSTGCRQYLVTPAVDEKGKMQDAEWFDEDRLDCFADVQDEDAPPSSGGPQRNPAPTK